MCNGDDSDEHIPISDVGPFPWHLGVYDAHCHPTDTMPSLDLVPAMRASVLTIMATRSQDQHLVASAAQSRPLASPPPSCQILPSFGWHPWFSHHLYDDLAQPDSSTAEPPGAEAHYSAVLHPAPPRHLYSSLPVPQSLSAFIASTRAYLQAHPRALVGEIGLDRSFRVPDPSSSSTTATAEPDLTPGGREGRTLTPCRVALGHQQAVLTAQLRLAGELGRAVSVHGVGAHGVLYETLRSTWKGWERDKEPKRRKKEGGTGSESGNGKEVSPDVKTMKSGKPFPPRICLHSYSGSPQTMVQYLDRAVPATVFFSFSRVINFSTPARDKAVECIKAAPADRILVESDLHVAGERMDAMLEQIVRLVCEIRGWDLEEGVRRLGKNWNHFALGVVDDE